MSLLTKYRITIIHNESETEVHPLQEDLVVQCTRQSGFFFFRRRIKNDLLLWRDDFAAIRTINEAENRCLPITVNVYRRSTDTLEFTGVTYLNNATFDYSRCTVVLKIESNDKYAELLRVWTRETNILAGTTKVGVNTNYKDISGSPSDIEYFEDVQTLSIGFPGTQQFPNTNWPDPNEGWVMLYDRVEVIDGVIPGTGVTAKRTTRWGREFSTTGPAAATLGGWRACTGGYFRDFPSVLKSEGTSSELVSFGTTPGEWYYEQFTRVYSWIPADEYAFGNGVRLEVALNKLLDGTGITVVSNFFGINPAGATPTNDPYTDLYYQDVVVFQRTDIKKPLASSPASKGTIAMQDFLKQLKAQYNTIEWVVGDELHIEHVSYKEVFDDGTDWTVQDADALVGTYVFDYSGQEYPQGELWYHDGEGAAASTNTFGQTFKRFEVVYNYEAGLDVAQNCAPAFTEPVENVSDKVCNDVASIVANPDNFQDNGFTFIACHTYDGNRMMSGANNILQSPGALAYLYEWDRPFPRAIFRPTTGGIQFYYFEVRKPRVQTEIEATLANLSEFNEVLPQRTQMGWGEVETAEYSLMKQTLKLVLKHD